MSAATRDADALLHAHDRAMAEAYSAAGTAWHAGPRAVYGSLAEVLVGRSPVPVAGAAVVDIGAGTGAGSAAARRAGADRVVAVDVAPGVLAVDAANRPPAVIATAILLPFADETFDVALAAFSLNHLSDPATGLREAARVVRSGGAVVASAYADDDDHPAKRVVADVLSTYGWRPSQWQLEMYRTRTPQLADEAGCRTALAAAGLTGTVSRIRVGLPHLDALAIIEWRLGMAQHAAFVAALDDDRRDAVIADARAALGRDCPPLVRSMMIITAER